MSGEDTVAHASEVCTTAMLGLLMIHDYKVWR